VNFNSTLHAFLLKPTLEPGACVGEKHSRPADFRTGRWLRRQRCRLLPLRTAGLDRCTHNIDVKVPVFIREKVQQGVVVLLRTPRKAKFGRSGHVKTAVGISWKSNAGNGRSLNPTDAGQARF
jgi:hypothetical protein